MGHHFFCENLLMLLYKFGNDFPIEWILIYLAN